MKKFLVSIQVDQMPRDNRGSKRRLPSGHFWISLSLPYLLLLVIVISKFNLTTIIKPFYTGLNKSLWFQTFKAPRICRQSVHEDGKVVSPRHHQPLPQEIFLVLIYVKAESHPGPQCGRKYYADKKYQ